LSLDPVVACAMLLAMSLVTLDCFLDGVAMVATISFTCLITCVISRWSAIAKPVEL